MTAAHGRSTHYRLAGADVIGCAHCIGLRCGCSGDGAYVRTHPTHVQAECRQHGISDPVRVIGQNQGAKMLSAGQSATLNTWLGVQLKPLGAAWDGYPAALWCVGRRSGTTTSG